MALVFISYSNKHAATVSALADDIEALGHDVWLDRELAGGHIWWDQILASIRDCAVFVFALAPDSLDSEACRLELAYASDLGKTVVPIVITDGVSPGRLPPILAEVQSLDYIERNHGTALGLGRAFGHVSPSAPLPDPLPQAPNRPVSVIDNLGALVESPPGMAFEKQTALLLRLKQRLNDPAHARDAKQLLQTFRRRDDLFAKVAVEIDAALKTVQPRQRPHSKSISAPRPVPARKPNTARPSFAQRFRRLVFKLIVLFGLAFALSVLYAIETGGVDYLESPTFWEAEVWVAVGSAAVTLWFFYSVIKAVFRAITAPFRRN